MEDTVFPLVVKLFEFVGALLVLGAGTERGTQLVKVLANTVIGLATKKFKIAGDYSFILAAVSAIVVAYYFNVNIVGGFDLLKGLDPELLSILNGLVFWLTSNKIHDKFFKSSPPKP